MLETLTFVQWNDSNMLMDEKMEEQGTLPDPQTSVYLSLAAYSDPAPVAMDRLTNMIHHLEVCTCRRHRSCLAFEERHGGWSVIQIGRDRGNTLTGRSLEV